MDPAASLVVHALLVCRKAAAGEGGALTIEQVLEVLPVDALPGDVGPLTFLALVRNLPEGPGRGAFVVRTPAPERRDVARCPLEVTVPKGYAGRQVALQVRLPRLPVARAGWYEVGFEWQGVEVAATRFVVGARTSGTTGP
jgi:hypothetical protein